MLDLLLLLMVIIWGSNFSVIKLALREFPEATFNALRLVLASAVFLVAIAVMRARARAGRRPPEPPLTGAEWRLVCLLGLLGTVLYQLLFLAGIARTSVANSSLIFGCTPVAVAIMASIAGHDRLTAGALGRRGVVICRDLHARRPARELSTSTLAGDALIFGGMLCWSLYSVLAQPLLKRHSPLVITGLAMATGTVVYLMFAAVPMLRTNWETISATSWVLMASSSLLALAFSYMVWYTAVQRIGSSRTAIYSNLTPIVAMIVAAVWLGEQITRTQMLGAALILSGIAITRLSPARA